MINEKSEKELKTIIDNDYGVKITEKEVQEIGNTLMDLFETLNRIENYSGYEYEDYGNTVR